MRLPFWSRPAPDERQHAIATLQSLGPTSVPGLAAALSWSVPRTEKVLGELLRHGPAGLIYDVRSGTIRWGPPATSPSRPSPRPAGPGPSWTASPARSTGPPVPTSAPAGSSSSDVSAWRPTVVPPPPTATALRFDPSNHPLLDCPRCHTPMVPTGIPDVFACAMCGRRSTSGGSRVSTATSTGGGPVGPDPKIQQLIAAWATGQPTPCPQCHQPLRHTADGEFRCGSCGARVAYGAPSTATTSGGPAAGPGR